MRPGRHPETFVTTVTCATCGTRFETRSTASELRVDVCSHCHPAYTGRAVARSDGSRIARFERRWGARPSELH